MKYVRCTNTACKTSDCHHCNTLIERTNMTSRTNINGEDKDLPPLCVACGSPIRPHVLFFDESYSEELYKSASVQVAVSECDLLIVIGTMCCTSLPNQIVATCGRRKVPIIDINPNPNNEIKCAPLLQLIAKSDEALPSIVKESNKKKDQERKKQKKIGRR